MCVSAVFYNIFNNVKDRVVSASTALKNHNYEYMRLFFGWLPLEFVKRTFRCTTQLAMGYLINIPFRQHYK